MTIRALIGCVGKAGTGKSTKLRELADRCRRILIADPDGGWEPARGDVELEGARALLEHVRRQQLWDPQRPFRIVYHDDAERLAAGAGGTAFALQHCTLLIDEIAWCCKPSYLPLELQRCIQFGRRRRINLLYTTREPQEVHNLLFSQLNLGYFFRVEPGLGLDRIKRWYPQLAARLPLLPEFPPPVGFCTYGNPRLVALLGREGLDFSARKLVSSRRTNSP